MTKMRNHKFQSTSKKNCSNIPLFQVRLLLFKYKLTSVFDLLGTKRGKALYKIFKKKRLVKRKRMPRKIRDLKISLSEHTKLRNGQMQRKPDADMKDESETELKMDKSLNLKTEGTK